MGSLILLVKILHVFVSIFLIVVVLLQTGKGSDISGAFGGGGPGAFGARGAATFLTKLTTACAVIFMLTCLSQAFLISRETGSLIQETDQLPLAPPPGAGNGVPQSEGGAPILPENAGDNAPAPADKAPAPADPAAPAQEGDVPPDAAPAGEPAAK